MNVASTLLLGELGVAVPGTRLLIIGGEADLPLAAFDRAQLVDLVWMPFDSREQARAEKDARIRIHQHPTNAPVSDGGFTVVLIPGVPDRDLNRRSLAIARMAVAKTGWVIVAGANNEGARSFLSDAHEVFGDPFFSDYRSRHRYATFEGVELIEVRPEWYDTIGIAPGTWIETGLPFLRQKVLQATTAGVFAADGLDDGTRLLLEHLGVEPGQRVLDVGTGSGIIGAFAAAAGARVTMADTSLIAVATARRTMELNEFTGYRVVAGDTYDPIGDERYDLIVSNPPFHQGKKIDYGMPQRLIDEAPQHLQPDGRLVIVANAFLPYRKRMLKIFERVETVASTRRYHVLTGSIPR